nr:MAG TPA: hypothetical protein [Caudoviricetes sp.]
MSFCSDNSKAAGFRVCRFSFCTICGIACGRFRS